MRKLGVTLSMAVLLLLCVTRAAFPWGSAVHTSIDDQIGSRQQLKNSIEMFGGTGPDLFNFRYDQPAYLQFMYLKTHTDFMKVWGEAKFQAAQAYAFGFLSHNDLWGADVTAHHNGITFGQGRGYVVAKAEILKSMLMLEPVFASMPEPVVLDIAHTLVEAGIDILLTRVDPKIGEKLSAAALKPHPQFRKLLVEAYAGDLANAFGISEQEAADFISASDRQFSRIEVQYGQALMQDENAAVQLIGEQLAAFAVAYLAASGITLPAGTELALLAQSGIAGAMQICAPDFKSEVLETIESVDQQLEAHGVDYRHYRP